MHSHITFAIKQKEGSIMKESVKKLEALMKIGGIKKDICFLVISGIALIISIFKLIPLPFDAAWVAIILCGIPIIMEAAINATEIHTPKCPVYQNVDALPHTDPAEIKKNLVAQLTASVRWTQSVKNMVADGATDFTECGPGAVLQGLIKKIDGTVSAHGIA